MNSLINFASVLEGVKLPNTAKVFKEELEKLNSIHSFELSLSKNQMFSNFLNKITQKDSKILSNLENKINLNISNQELINSKIFKNLYDNFDNKNSTTDSLQIENINNSNNNNNNNNNQNLFTNGSFKNIMDTPIKEDENSLRESALLTPNELNNLNTSNNINNSNLNNTNNNEEDSIFANEKNLNESKDSNATSFVPLKKLNPKTKQIDDRDKKPFGGTSQLDKMLKLSSIKINQSNSNLMDSSSFFQNSHIGNINGDIKDISHLEIDEYVDDDDPGFDLYECDREYQSDTSKKLAEQYGYPERAVYKSKFKSLQVKEKDENKHKSRDENVLESKSNLPENAKFMKSNDPYYPIINNNVILDCFDMKIIINREKIGFESEKEIKFTKDMLIAGRYKYIKELGDAAFSTAIQCLDILENKLICIKIIKNNKDYFDQSIDEIKLLRYIIANGDPDEKCFLRVYDYFYFKEHLMIVSELLKDNLYDFYKYLNDNHKEYFTVARIQKLTKQILTCLEFIHSLKIIHCDLKPENILMKSISDVTCKVIDFGSSCFIHDHLSSYIQSRSYRAPEVILGCKYNFKIDLWSLGCILAEIYTGNVLFQNDSVQSMLARIIGICGPIPNWMYEKGKLVNDYFTQEKLIYMEPNSNDGNESLSQSMNRERSKKIHILVPKRTSLRKRLGTNDENFYNFVKGLLEIDPNLRMSATEALQHPFIKDTKYVIE